MAGSRDTAGKQDVVGRKPLILVDGSSYLYRAFHALPPLTTSRGEPTGAVLGVLNMIQKLLTEQEPECIAVVFDAKGKTFRDEIFEEYKANRPPMPDELRSQVTPLLEAIEAMGLHLLRVSGVEADDVIGTLASRASEAGWNVLVSTGDKDMAQLVDDRITLVNTMTGSRMDPAGVAEKFGVRPDQIVDYLALVGDSSDNIPGVPRVGPKTAAKWLGQFGSIEGIKANAAEIGGKIGESLRDNLDRLDLSRKLATIVCDLDLDVAPDSLQRGDPDLARLRKIYTRLELTSLLRNLPSGEEKSSADIPPGATEYEIVLDEKGLEEWLERLAGAELIAFDTETDSLDYMQARIVGLSFSI
ncbi:MAG: 5'-3' exonuclease H3TH domain-containing protein, partial [Gammaproteobacteria bacterium]